MSYTYRTDKLLDAIGNSHGYVNQQNCPKQWVGFAIELETELQEATFEIERLRKANFQLREGAEEQKQRIKRLEEFVDQLTNPKFTRDDLPKEALLQYIKRLEEAGNAMMSEPCEYTFEQWIKAKEAKP